MSEEWSEEYIDQINAEMATGCLNLIRELLVNSGVNMDRTPPMMYPEAICTLITKIVEEKTAALTTERDECRKALERYGQHDDRVTTWKRIEPGWYESELGAIRRGTIWRDLWFFQPHEAADFIGEGHSTLKAAKEAAEQGRPHDS